MPFITQIPVAVSRALSWSLAGEQRWSWGGRLCQQMTYWLWCGLSDGPSKSELVWPSCLMIMALQQPARMPAQGVHTSAILLEPNSPAWSSSISWSAFNSHKWASREPERPEAKFIRTQGRVAFRAPLPLLPWLVRAGVPATLSLQGSAAPVTWCKAQNFSPGSAAPSLTYSPCCSL